MSANDPKRTSSSLGPRDRPDSRWLVFASGINLVSGVLDNDRLHDVATGTLRFVRTGLRRAVSLVAIYVVALHTILLGIVPVAASASVAGDPFSIICHSDAQAGGAAEQTPGRPDVPGHACDHCILCSASAPPVLVSVFAGQLVPLRLLQVLQPASTAARSHSAITPHLARGPPYFA